MNDYTNFTKHVLNARAFCAWSDVSDSATRATFKLDSIDYVKVFGREVAIATNGVEHSVRFATSEQAELAEEALSDALMFGGVE